MTSRPSRSVAVIETDAVVATLSMTGEVAIIAECGTVILFDAQRGRQLVAWLARGAA